MKNFNDIYEEIYKNSGDELKRLKNKNRIINIFYIIFIIGCFIIFVLSIIYAKLLMLISFAGIMMVLIIMQGKQFTKYKIQYKEKVIKQFIKGYSDKLEYYPQRGISPREYNSARFDGYYDRYMSEDLIEGTILEDCKITMAEVHTEKEYESTDSDGHTTKSYITIFYGLFAKIDLNEFSTLDFKVVKNALFKNKNRLEMDSGQFEKIYDVVTDDKIGTLRIITSEEMQMLIDFKNANKVVPEISLFGNNLYIRFAIGNVFEPSMFKNDIDYSKLKKNYDMIKFIFKLTEDISRHIIEFEE